MNFINFIRFRQFTYFLPFRVFGSYTSLISAKKGENMLRSSVIRNFLSAHSHADLAGLYNQCMQCHVVVSSGIGVKDGVVWSDGIESWYPFVISDEESDNKLITYNFDSRVEGIGLTGWDWKNKISRWVAFDFDSILGHKKGLPDSVIKEIVSRVSDIPWVTIRKSTSGKGIHLYVDLNIPTQNRAEHSAVARAVLHRLSALCTYNFKDKVDICGGNMWVWHRKMTDANGGLKVIRKGIPLEDVPNWQEHVEMIKRGKSTPKDYDPLVLAKAHISLDDDHRKLIAYLQEHECHWWWDNDKNMLITHTSYLTGAHTDLNLKGMFRTTATGKNLPDHNCFLFPIRNGAWIVRRFSKGCTEDALWELDELGWTRCYFNIDTDLKTAARTYQGIEHPNGSYIFKSAEEAARAALVLGIPFDVPLMANYCSANIREHKDGRLIVAIEDKEGKLPHTEMGGWIKENKFWKRIYNKQKTSNVREDLYQYDELIRHLVSNNGDDYGWAVKVNDNWNFESLQHVKLVLESMSLKLGQVKEILGTSIVKCWRLVNKPFANEYPGDRTWNMNSAQIRYEPSIDVPSNLMGECPNWYRIIKHVSVNLDSVIKENDWAKTNNIYDGTEYLICWIASLFQEPTEPLPYLFLYGPQNSGKSILHEALSLLITHGYIKADNALINKSGFNAEMESAVLCVVEEVNLSKSHEAANRIKDWVTARDITIHRKMKTPYMIQNVSHWIQTSNEHNACPIFPGDTRIVVLFVDILKELIPKKSLIESLKEEAPKFMAYILNYQIPESPDRLNIPVITTSDKSNMEYSNKKLLEIFIDDCCYKVDGEMIKFSDFYNKFIEWMGPTTEFWSKQKVGKELPPQYPRGRLPATGQFYVGNISFDIEAEPKIKLITIGDKLVEENSI